VTTDNYQGALMAVNRLVDIGREKIAHLSGPLVWWEAAERKRGWVDALLNAGLDVTELYCAEGDWSAKSGEQAFNQLLRNYPDMDAIFVANDQMALSVLQQAHLRGISIPDELSVIGFDNIDEAEYFFPALTTIEQDFQLLGETAVSNLVEMIEAQQKNISVQAKIVFIEPKLILRKSTQKPAVLKNL
jgi:DNA-binding LacI/PurR family transcriptional regulator